jgi:type I restriction enzyme, S subunit
MRWIICRRLDDVAIGKPALWSGELDECAFQNTLIRIRPHDVEPLYLLHYFRYVALTGGFTGHARGVGIHHLGRARIAGWSTPVPPPDEQRRIVDILEDHLSRLYAAEALSKSAVRRLDSLQVSGPWRATHSLPGSGSRTLSEVAEVRLGRQRSPKNHAGNRMRPYLRAANVGWDELRFDDVKQMQFSESESETYELHDGDVLLTEASGSASEVGKSAVYRDEIPGVCFQNTLLRVRCDEGVDSDFVQLYLLAEARSGKFVAESRGVGIHHLGRARLASWPILLPAGHLQVAAVKRARELVESTLRAREATQAATTRAHILRHSLLAAAFSGRLTGRSSDLDTAEELSVTTV